MADASRDATTTLVPTGACCGVQGATAPIAIATAAASPCAVAVATAASESTTRLTVSIDEASSADTGVRTVQPSRNVRHGVGSAAPAAAPIASSTTDIASEVSRASVATSESVAASPSLAVAADPGMSSVPLEVLTLVGAPWGRRSAAGPSSEECEYAIDLRPSHGEVGCRWRTADGSLPPEAAVAARSDWVRMYADEFLEAFAHSALGKWGAEWLGFRAKLSVLPYLRRNGTGVSTHASELYSHQADHGILSRSPLPHSPSSRPILLKRLVFRRLHTAYCKPRALCLRVTARPPMRPDDRRSAKVRQRARVDVLVCGEVHEASLAQQDVLSAQHPEAKATPPPATHSPSDDGRPDGDGTALDRHCAGDVLEGVGGRLAEMMRQLFIHVSAEEQAELLASFCAQMAELIDEIAEGYFFQFGAASLWCICEAARGSCLQDSGDGGAQGGHAHGSGEPAVRLSHFADLSMHREAGCNSELLAALVAIQHSLRSFKSASECDPPMHSHSASEESPRSCILARGPERDA